MTSNHVKHALVQVNANTIGSAPRLTQTLLEGEGRPDAERSYNGCAKRQRETTGSAR